MGEQFDNPDPFHPMPDAFAAPLRAHYLAAITWTDRMAGRVLAALDDSGEADRTIVTFTGDVRVLRSVCLDRFSLVLNCFACLKKIIARLVSRGAGRVAQIHQL